MRSDCMRNEEPVEEHTSHGARTLVMPMPLSVSVMVLFVLSGVMWMKSSGWLSSTDLSVRPWYLRMA